MASSTTQSDLAATFLQRVDAVEARLAALAACEASAGLTEADAKTGERWDGGQVWAHLAEFLPYWIQQANDVVAAQSPEPVPFGRVKSDPNRIAAIARDRELPTSANYARLAAGIVELRQFLRALPQNAWQARGLHPTLGVMSLERIVEEFMVGHLEEHAHQLTQLSGA
jgi:hypothetical protein